MYVGLESYYETKIYSSMKHTFKTCNHSLHTQYLKYYFFLQWCSHNHKKCVGVVVVWNFFYFFLFLGGGWVLHVNYAYGHTKRCLMFVEEQPQLRLNKCVLSCDESGRKRRKIPKRTHNITILNYLKRILV